MSEAALGVAPFLMRVAQAGFLETAKQAAARTRDHADQVRVSATRGDANSNPLKAATNSLHLALTNLLDIARSADTAARELDFTSQLIEGLNARLPPTPNKDFTSSLRELDKTTKTVAGDMARVVAEAREADEGLVAAVKVLQNDWRQFADSAASVAQLAPEMYRADVRSTMNDMSTKARLMLGLAKAATQSPEAFMQLERAFGDANAALRKLLASAFAASPGSQEFSASLQQIQAAMAYLDKPPSELLVAPTARRRSFRSPSTVSRTPTKEEQEDPVRLLTEGLRVLSNATGCVDQLQEVEEYAALAQQSGAALASVLGAVGTICQALPPRMEDAGPPFKNAARALCASTTSFIGAMQTASRGRSDPKARETLIDASTAVSEDSQRLRELLPGQHEMDLAALHTHTALSLLDEAIFAVAGGKCVMLSGRHNTH